MPHSIACYCSWLHILDVLDSLNSFWLLRLTTLRPITYATAKRPSEYASGAQNREREWPTLPAK